jgi:hypothetical protein
MVGFEAANYDDNNRKNEQNIDLSRMFYSNKNKLAKNEGLAFMGITKVGDFDIDFHLAQDMLMLPNPKGIPNSNVLRPFRNGSDLVRINSERWIIDFGVELDDLAASLYEAPYEYLKKHVHDFRQTNNRKAYKKKW